MAKRKLRWTPKSIQARIKTGRGQGVGLEYKPWLNIQDVPSIGHAHRIKGLKSGRVHHLLSKLEANILYIYPIDAIVVDVQLVSHLDSKTIVGRPIIHVTVDGFSRLIVDTYITLDHQSRSRSKVYRRMKPFISSESR
jgi:hypothetical protein